MPKAAVDYLYYLRAEKLPHMWCPGCGIGIVVKSMIGAIDSLGWDKNDIAVISGIGCTSRAPGYMDMNTLHTTHGRALSFATGVKMAAPDKHIIVISGDGDATAIGGNHFIHACRRNIDITLIINNNNIYGMTGGQFSPTTPYGARAATTPHGNIDPAFDLVELAKGAGATYVARGAVDNARMMEKYFKDGMEHHGFSVIEILSNCHTQYGRRNKMADAITMIDWISDQVVSNKKAAKMSPEELEGKIITGEMYHNTELAEYTDEYAKLIERVQAKAALKA
ncbi:2-oxoacid:ferredoxin oxidoreductase subunit beta [candidate division LCP-89 bacterium B3_LCP]|uniref:2-oxoacid:ferredoxin oxidoreductase subunit beta n=1 Tax=candidate division LCP-89 bacterium B3_LCP TaxID=2012998 RepID=A0A532V5M6_UNCL8|nr:MAG: 2-oxoacid:ferredoxin oxidoreductase subunit beta [candidate division LCP-89 bacterium B3_LCP]